MATDDDDDDDDEKYDADDDADADADAAAMMMMMMLKMMMKMMMMVVSVHASPVQLLEFLIWNFIFTKRGRVSHSWPVGDFHGEKGDFCDALTSVIMMMMMILNVQA